MISCESLCEYLKPAGKLAIHGDLPASLHDANFLVFSTARQVAIPTITSAAEDGSGTVSTTGWLMASLARTWELVPVTQA